MRLLDVEAIKELKARYFRLLDCKQWEMWREVFTDDCRYDRTSTAASGPDAFVAGVAHNLAEVQSVHHGHMPEIRLTSAATARGIWAMQDVLRWPPGADVPEYLRSDPRQTGLVGYGYYEEEYRNDDGTWRISFMRLTRLAVIAFAEQTFEMANVWPAPSADWLSRHGE